METRPKIGRPRIYETIEELELAIESYFFIPITVDSGSKLGPEKNETDKFTFNPRPTVTGLALHLGFCDKTTLYDYRDRPEFSHPIKAALTLIEKHHEEGLSGNSVAGHIFALKNKGWKDKIETGFTDTNGNDIPPVHIYIPDNNRSNDSSDTAKSAD